MILLAPPFAFKKSFIVLFSSILFFSFHALIFNEVYDLTSLKL